MGAGKKILVVEDSATMRQQVCFALSRDGYQTVEAGDGVEALAVAAANKDISLVISDVNMPNMNGLEFLKSYREKGFAAPIIMLTTEGSKELITRAKELGAKGWLVKPFKPEQLVDVVKKLAA